MYMPTANRIKKIGIPNFCRMFIECMPRQEKNSATRATIANKTVAQKESMSMPAYSLKPCETMLPSKMK